MGNGQLHVHVGARYLQSCMLKAKVIIVGRMAYTQIW